MIAPTAPRVIVGEVEGMGIAPKKLLRREMRNRNKGAVANLKQETGGLVRCGG